MLHGALVMLFAVASGLLGGQAVAELLRARDSHAAGRPWRPDVTNAAAWLLLAVLVIVTRHLLVPADT